MGAAPMDEDIDPTNVQTALQRLIDKARQNGNATGIALERLKRLHRWITTAATSTRASILIVTWEQMLHGFAFLLKLDQVRLGNEIWQQRAGVPIGGLANKAAASLLLGYAQHRWEDAALGQQSNGFGTDYDSMHSACADIRYVDDLLSVSTHWCKTCLGLRASCIYPPQVRFELQAGEPGDQPWLDLQMRIPLRDVEETFLSSF